MNRCWKALGEYVLLAKYDAENEFGLILEQPFSIHSVGGFVPIDLTEGDHVVLHSEAVYTQIEPSNPTSPISVHYSDLVAFSLEEGEQISMEEYYGETEDLLYDSSLER